MTAGSSTGGGSDTSHGRVLSELIGAGAGNVRFRFGASGDWISGGQLLDRGKRHLSIAGDAASLAMVMTNDQPTVELVVAAIVSRVRLISLPPPGRSADPNAYVAFFKAACLAQGASTVVARDDIAQLLQITGLDIRGHTELASEPLAAAPAGGFELVQFSSGSTDQPKAVCLSDAALAANISAIIEWLEPERGDAAVSWLPLSHDMGLVGMLLTNVAMAGASPPGDLDLVILDPVEFLRRPDTWLTAMSELSCTVTAAPDFAFRLCVNRASSGPYDLSSLRRAIVGGETVRAATLRSFCDTFAPAQFREEAFCPAYGMAEIGLAATITPVRERWQERTVLTEALAHQEFAAADQDTMASAPTTTLVASGRPLGGYEVRCDAAEGNFGTILIRGPSTGVDGATKESFAGDDGWLRTGDFGIMIDGSIVVSGRGDDHIIANGRNIYAPAVEDAVGEVDGVRSGRTAAVALPSGDWIVAAECEARGSLSELEWARLRRQIGQAAVRATSSRPADVVLLQRGGLPITTSGKLQRNETVRRYLLGRLEESAR